MALGPQGWFPPPGSHQERCSAHPSPLSKSAEPPGSRKPQSTRDGRRARGQLCSPRRRHRLREAMVGAGYRPDQGERGKRGRSGARRPGGPAGWSPPLRAWGMGHAACGMRPAAVSAARARPALPSSPALHLHGALRPQVGPQHVLQTPGRADVDRQRCLGSGHLGFGVQALHGRHSGARKRGKDRF